MFKAVKISDKVEVICLLRLEKTPKMSSFARCDLIEKSQRELRETLSKENLGRLEEWFFVLGGASAALLISGNSLDDTAEIKVQINNTLNSLLKQPEELDSEVFVFPAAVLESEGKNHDFPIPILVFMKTKIYINRLQRMLHAKKLADVKPMLGYGGHNCVFYSMCANLSDVKERVNNLARLFGEPSQTYTIIGVPSKQNRDRENQLSGPPFLFHTALKFSPTSSIQKFKRKLAKIIGDPKFADLFKGLPKEDIVGYTPGRMDLTVNFKSACVSDAFDIVCCLGDIEEVIDTVTWPNLRIN